MKLARTGTQPRLAGCTIGKTLGGVEVNIHSINVARKLFVKHGPLRYRPLVALLRSALGHRVMIASDGAEWQQTHYALMPHFLPGHVIRHYVPVIQAVSYETFANLASRAASTDFGSMPLDVEVEPLMRQVLARVMGHVVIGRALSTDEAVCLQIQLDAVTQPVRYGVPALINRALGAMLRALGLSERQPVILPERQRTVIQDLLAWIGSEIEEAKLAGTPLPLVDSLERRFEHLSPAVKRRCIAAECTMLFVAGIETTAAALTFAVAEIVANPAVHEAVVHEARSVDRRRPSGQSPVEEFPLIYRVVQETLRRHTIVPTMLREAASDCEIQDKAGRNAASATVTIRRGSILRYFPVQGHLRRRIWENPQAFDPERFGRPLTSEQQNNYNPFGVGPQSCMGRSMALIESVLVLEALFRCLDVKHREITQPIPVQRNVLFTNRPVGVTAQITAAGSAAHLVG